MNSWKNSPSRLKILNLLALAKNLQILEERIKALHSRIKTIKKYSQTEYLSCQEQIDQLILFWQQQLITTQQQTIDIYQKINQLDHPLHKQVLSLLFLDGKNIQEIANFLSYSLAYIKEVKKIALAEFIKIIS